MTPAAMVIIKVKAEGRFKINDFVFPVYKLENGEFAVSQSAVHEYFTGSPSKTGSRYPLSLSKLRGYIPKPMLKATEFGAELYGKVTKMFLSQEWLSLCKAVIHAGFKGELSYNWLAADRKALLLLMEFSDLGINKTLELAISASPVVTIDDFEKNLRMLLSVRFLSRPRAKK